MVTRYDLRSLSPAARKNHQCRTARWVIHTVGPVYSPDRDQSAVLRSCYVESLRVAAELGAATVAFPAISTGVYRWPMADAAEIAVAAVRSAQSSVTEIRFVLFSPDALAAFERAVVGQPER